MVVRGNSYVRPERVELPAVGFLFSIAGLVYLTEPYLPMRHDSVTQHVNADDYFATLATILDLLRQDLEKKKSVDARLLRNVRDDLLYLQANYRIVRR